MSHGEKTMIERYAGWIYRRRWVVIVATALSVAGLVPAFIELSGRVGFELFVDRSSDAWRGEALLKERFGQGRPNLVVLATTDGKIDQQQVARDGRRLTRQLRAEPKLTNVQSYWDGGASTGLSNRGRDRALILARIRGDQRAVHERIKGIHERLVGRHGMLEVELAGEAEFGRQAVDVFTEDLQTAELITGPMVLIALLIVFGSIVSALIPVGMAAYTVLGASGFLLAVTTFADVSGVALVMVTILALGLSVDYSLLITSRFRDEIAKTGEVESALAMTMATAGRTVLFSAVLMTLALAGMLVVPLNFLQSFSFASMGTALTTGFVALVPLPALLAALGSRIDKGRVRRAGRAETPVEHRFWHRVARLSMSRSRLVAVLAIAGFGVAAIPIALVDPELADDRIFNHSTKLRQTGDILRSEFAALGSAPVLVAVEGGVHPHRIDRYAARLSGTDGIAAVEAATGVYADGRRVDRQRDPRSFRKWDATWFRAQSEANPLSSEGVAVIERVREVPSEFERVLVTGDAANFKDVSDAMVGALPAVVGLIAIAGFIGLAIQFSSLILPLVALGLTGLGLCAVFGLYVLTFQEGILDAALGITTTGRLYIIPPIMIAVLAFGLALDYQVFILSRIKEEYDRLGNTAEAVAVGLGRSGPIITAAATLIAIVFLGMGLAATSTIGLAVGMGLGITVLVDAFIIRATVLPAFVHLVGDRIWWAPGWLESLNRRFGLGGPHG